jgi:hypothetical protein
MPLCPQITNTPITVVQNADFTVSSVLPVVAATTTQLAATNAEVAAAAAAAAAAASAAAAAQTAAAAALTEAGIAYNASVNSLQKSANTIVNGSNQITGINGNGITIYSGADPTTTGSRVVLNSLGLAAYGPGTSYAVSNAVGNGTTVTYTASGHNFAVGSSITVSDLAPAGYNGTFLVTAISGSSTFTVANTTTATLTDSSGIAFGPGRSVNITNAVGNGSSVTYTASNHGYSVGTSVNVSGLAPDGYNGTFLITSVVAGTSFTVSNGTTATLTDASGVAQTPTLAISATTGNAVFQGSVTGSTIIGGTLNIAGKAVIDSTGLLTATGATITGAINATSGYFGTSTNGFSISSTGLVGVGSGTIVGGTISGTTFTNGSTFSVSSIGELTASAGTIGGFTINSTGFASASYGWSLTSNGTLTGGNSNTLYYGYINVGGGTAGSERLIITGNSNFNGTGIFSGNLTVQSYIYNPGYQVSTAGGAARINDATTPTARLVAASGSSLRFKQDVVDVSTINVLNPKLLLTVPVRAFKYRDDYLDLEDERSGVYIPGFIAEELDEIYPIAVDHDIQGRASRWSSDFIVPSMLALIQEQEARIQALEGK